MPHYIALIHKDADSCCGVSFPDLPGVFTAGAEGAVVAAVPFREKLAAAE
jgi:predicted RNase H-like HicB family nuclease